MPTISVTVVLRNDLPHLKEIFLQTKLAALLLELWRWGNLSAVSN
jgi:hypothetical protein